ncbi:FCD domain-containing protein [Castellaniella sp. FW104-16D08]|uniref:FCD domain-containing protein n=1 Tax=unclassified Castellaniella TaxID=2617606 RepID=UPI00331586C2
MVFTPVTPPVRTRLSDIVYDQLEGMVAEGVLRPGQALPSERELAQQLGVSRPPLREALLKLESRQLIEGRAGGGYRIANASAVRIADPLEQLMAHHPQAAEDMLEMREVLEAMAVRLAATRATEADLQRLLKATEALEAAFARHQNTEAVDELAALDAQFHLALAEATHNVALIHTVHAIGDLLRSTVIQSYQAIQRSEGALESLIEQHRVILDAVALHDPDKAQEAVHTHLAFIKHTASRALV